MIRAKSQYLPPAERPSLETSYSATFKGQAPLRTADNKAVDRRRIRSLYSEPYIDPINQPENRPAAGDKEKSKEMNNKLAEAKEVVLKQYHYIQLCQPIRDIGWVQTLKQHLWGCALPNPRDAKDEVLGPSHHSQGAAGGEPPPPLERPKPRKSSGVVRFALDVNQTE
ncbi:hypothetical protein FQN60_000298 [Etheostoma spectabile]|uniref:Uncharacterized protein n=1 Tax=Etheostoma spectabile TaxID=54343 RepID=A0A5J5CVV6_9PERO|nr:hypothetical protein FQN60_000298 [Etheostoma spectabile]